jgi:hypothetical protein
MRLRPTWIVVALAVLAITGAGAAPAQPKERTDCGKYDSTSIYPRAKVIAIRGVGCRDARRVAKRYDHKGQAIEPWECFLAHGGGRRLFSCGYGGSQGDVRDFPHALVARGVGEPTR